MKEKKLVYDVGINDADYKVQIKETIGHTEDGRQIQKFIWICPFYRKWYSMMCRCYSEKSKKDRPTYNGAAIVPEWHYFMTFRGWMEKQDWEGKQLDKDLLIPGNKLYGPDTCVFLEARVNGFLTESTKTRGDWPVGVYLDKSSGKYRALCWDTIAGKQKKLGRFDNPKDAHQAWLDKKIELAHALALQQSDPRIAAALIDRYENYEKHFGGVSSHA